MTKKTKERIHANKKYPDRIYRGRILKAVREHVRGIDINDIGPIIDVTFNEKQDKTWLEQMVQRLVQDSLLSYKKHRLTLPHE